jgi:hypothetical protein
MESKKRASAPVTPSASPTAEPLVDTKIAPTPVAQADGAGAETAVKAGVETAIVEGEKEAVEDSGAAAANAPGHDVEVRDSGSLKRPAESQKTAEDSNDTFCDTAEPPGAGRKARRTMQQDPPRPPGPAPGTRACLVPMRATRDNLQTLYESGSASFYDIILRVGKSLQLPAHRFILAAHSPFFARMLSVQMIEQDATEIQLEDINEDALAAIVNSFYSASGTIALSATNVGNIIRCASRLQTVSVERVAVNFFCNCLEPDCGTAALCFATEMAATGSGPTKYLLQQCLSYVCEHFRVCRTQTAFLMLSYETMRLLLASDSLECDEISIFNGLVAWVKHDEVQRSLLLTELLPLIRFPQMLPADLRAVCAEPLLTSLPGGLLMPLLAECVPGAGKASRARLRPRSGSVKKEWSFSRLSTAAYGMGKGLTVLDHGAIVTTVDGGDGGTAWFV